MGTDRFLRALPLILRHEGGHVEHPDDPGGATNHGVTRATYDAWRRRLGEPVRPVIDITPEEVADIFRAGYWDAVRGDDLPDGVAYAVADAAIMSGPARAAKWLQRAAGVPEDGIVGPQTLTAVAALSAPQVIRSVCASRLAFCRRLQHWRTFGRGWTARVDAVERQALAWATEDAPEAVAAPELSPMPRARGEVSVVAAAAAHPGKLAAYVTTAGVAGDALAGFADLEGPVGYAVAAALVIAAATMAVRYLRRTESEAAA